MSKNHWLQNIAGAFGIAPCKATRRRGKNAAPVAADLQVLETREVMTASPIILAAGAVNSVEQSLKTGNPEGKETRPLMTASPINLGAAANKLEQALKSGGNVIPAIESGGSVQPGVAGKPAAAGVTAAATSQYVYSAVTIKNSTNGTVNYSFNWPNGTVKNFSLAPGAQRVHYISALNKTATISYDKSFSAGIQKQTYSLAARNVTRAPGFYLVEPTPTFSEGKLYTFKGVTNGVQLYS